MARALACDAPLRHLRRIPICGGPFVRRRGERGIRRDSAARLAPARSGRKRADALLTGRVRAAKGSTAQRSKLKGFQIVAKPELGTKRLCPKCATVFVPPVATRGRPEPVAPVVAPVVEEEVAVPETAEAELISLEEAEKETEGTKTPAAEGGDEVEVDDEALDDAACIVPEEEEDEDVTDIIGEGI